MRELGLLFHFEPERLSKMRRALLPLRFRVKAVERAYYAQTLGALAGVEDSSDAPFDGEELPGEMLVMAGLTSSRMDQLLAALRKGGVGRIDCKAVLTETNRHWTPPALYTELRREHEAMQQGAPVHEQTT